MEMVIDEGGEFLPTIGIQVNGAMDVPGLIERPEVILLHGGSELASSEDVVNQCDFSLSRVVIGFPKEEEEHGGLRLRKQFLPGATCSTEVGHTGDEGLV